MRHWLRAPFAIAGVALRRLTRDRVGLFFTFVLPLLIIVLLGAALPGSSTPIGLFRAGTGTSSERVVTDLRAEKGLKVRVYASEAALRKAVRRNEVSGGVMLPADFDSSLAAGGTTAVTLVIDPTSQSASAVRTQVDAAVSRSAVELEAARFAVSVVGAGLSPADALSTAQRIAAGPAAVRIDTSTGGRTGVNSMSVAQYAAVGELVLFIFLMSLVGAGELVEARRLGVTRRMLASPTPVGRVIVGEGLGRVLIASLQALLIALLTAALFHVAWGDPVAVAAVIILFALVSVGAGLLVGTIVHTAEQATSIGPVVGIALGMIGGCMWPLEIVPSGLRAVGHLTPHAWALDALIKTMGERRHLLDIAPQIGVLAAMALVLVPLAAWRLRHAITSA